MPTTPPADGNLRRRRADYEASVRALAFISELLLANGMSEKEVARRAVEGRNRLKRLFRSDLPPDLIAAIEARNRRKYGNPIGPDADQLLDRYGSWKVVIAAASRPADLSGG